MESSNRLNLPKTWLIDLDGTLVKHNSYLNGEDELLSGTDVFFNKKISNNDVIIILTARNKKYKKQTINFLQNNNIRYNYIIFDLPVGERILINDKKPDGTYTAYCYNIDRDTGIHI